MRTWKLQLLRVLIVPLYKYNGGLSESCFAGRDLDWAGFPTGKWRSRVYPWPELLWLFWVFLCVFYLFVFFWKKGLLQSSHYEQINQSKAVPSNFRCHNTFDAITALQKRLLLQIGNWSRKRNCASKLLPRNFLTTGSAFSQYSIYYNLWVLILMSKLYKSCDIGIYRLPLLGKSVVDSLLT